MLTEFILFLSPFQNHDTRICTISEGAQILLIVPSEQVIRFTSLSRHKRWPVIFHCPVRRSGRIKLIGCHPFRADISIFLIKSIFPLSIRIYLFIYFLNFLSPSHFGLVLQPWKATISYPKNIPERSYSICVSQNIDSFL